MTPPPPTTPLEERVFHALFKYPGWDDSAIGFALKNSEDERRKIARAVAYAILHPEDDDDDAA